MQQDKYKLFYVPFSSSTRNKTQVYSQNYLKMFKNSLIKVDLTRQSQINRSLRTQKSQSKSRRCSQPSIEQNKSPIINMFSQKRKAINQLLKDKKTQFNPQIKKSQFEKRCKTIDIHQIQQYSIKNEQISKLYSFRANTTIRLNPFGVVNSKRKSISKVQGQLIQQKLMNEQKSMNEPKLMNQQKTINSQKSITKQQNKIQNDQKLPNIMNNLIDDLKIIQSYRKMQSQYLLSKQSQQIPIGISSIYPKTNQKKRIPKPKLNYHQQFIFPSKKVRTLLERISYKKMSQRQIQKQIVISPKKLIKLRLYQEQIQYKTNQQIQINNRIQNERKINKVQKIVHQKTKPKFINNNFQPWQSSQLDQSNKRLDFNISDMFSKVKQTNMFSKVKQPDQISKVRLSEIVSKVKQSDKISKVKLSDKISKVKLSDKISKVKLSDQISKVKLYDQTTKSEQISQVKLSDQINKFKQSQFNSNS